METAASAAPAPAAAAPGPAVPDAQAARLGKAPARLRPRGGFGGYLHELRRERGLTARQLAAAAGVHHTYVSKLERGDRQAPDEPVVEALAAALGASPAQLDQLRWRAGLTPHGAGAPGQDDPTLTLVAEALANPGMTDPARDQLRRAIAQAIQGPVSAPWSGTGQAYGGQSAAPSAVSAGWSAPAGFGGQVPPVAPVPPVPPAAPVFGASMAGPPVPGVPVAPLLSPEAPPDARAQALASLLGGWQTVDEAAAELRVTAAYLLSLVQVGQLRAWALPGGAPGSLTGLRLRRDDVLALFQPVRL